MSPGSSWTVELYEGDFLSGGKLLGKSTAGSCPGYNTFGRTYFKPPIKVTPGSYYTLKPTGSGTWYINQNNLCQEGRMSGLNPIGQCWGAQWDGAFRVNCDPNPDRPTAYWKCYPGIGVPLRENGNGDVECMALDGYNCLWSDNCANVLSQYSTSTSLIPLTCGTGHRNAYGSPGYENPIHWCYKGWDFMKPWYCYPGLTSPMKINSQGNPECLATDGRNCNWGTVSCNVKTVYDASAITNIIPLVCGRMHLNTYGITGYEGNNHWCWNIVNQEEPQCLNIQSCSCAVSGLVCPCPSTNICTGNIPCPLANS